MNLCDQPRHEGPREMLIPLKLVRDQKLQQQLYDQLRGLIVTARLPAGVRMPSTRMLADQFSISRITVLLAYERLIAEGYLQTLPAIGTFVCHGAASRDPARGPPVQRNQAPHALVHPACEPLAGRPDPGLFPTGRWRVLMRGALDQVVSRIGTRQPGGNPALRTAVAQWLAASRGLAVAPEQVLLVSGRRQALHIAAHLLLGAGSRAVIEDPCAADAASLFASAGASLLRVGVDADGLRTADLPDGPIALAHITPEHQRPLGSVLSAPRRRALLEWANRVDATIVVEDCDADLRYEPSVAPPLMAMDAHDRVIHIGCFATTLGPVLTLGYMVLPHRLVGPTLAVRRLMDEHVRWVEEAVLADFLDSGGYARHVHRLRKAYLGRRDQLTDLMRRHFGGDTQLSGGVAGLRLAWTVPPHFGAAGTVAELARSCGLDASVAGPQAVLLGFGLPSEQQTAHAVPRLAAILQANVARAHDPNAALLAD